MGFSEERIPLLRKVREALTAEKRKTEKKENRK
jgi:hypothetical protein